MSKLRKGDPVMVISGKFKGKLSSIENIEDESVFLKKINEVKKAVKGKGFIKKTLPLHISNVSYYLDEEKKPSKISFKFDDKGSKKRCIKRTGALIQ